MVATPESPRTAAAANYFKKRQQQCCCCGHQCQHAFLILTTSKGKDRKEHDLLRHEAEFITFVSQVATAACEELVPYDGGGDQRMEGCSSLIN